MFSVRIIGVVVAVSSVIIAYFMGVAAGRKEGFEQGKCEGKRDGSMRAYAVGYDRGKRASQEEPEDEPPPENENRKAYGCLLVLLVLITSIILMLGFSNDAGRP